MEITPSILSADFGHLARAVLTVQDAGARTIHIDVMDGLFVPNLSFGPQIVAYLRKESNAILEVHLMVENPENWIKPFANAGADRILVHVESTPHIHRALTLINDAGLESGLVINPGTSVQSVRPLLSLVDQVLVMTVDPGFGGQKFISDMVRKLDEFNAIRAGESDLKFKLEVDGGINKETIAAIAGHGVDLAVAGSAIYDGVQPAENFKELEELTKC